MNFDGYKLVAACVGSCVETLVVGEIIFSFFFPWFRTQKKTQNGEVIFW